MIIVLLQGCKSSSDSSGDSATSATSTSVTQCTSSSVPSFSRTNAVNSSCSSCSSSVNTPDNYVTILNKTVSITPTSKSSVSDLDRVLIGYSSSFMSLDNSSYSVIELDSSVSTYNEVFLKTFQLVKEGSNSCYRLDSEKHSNYSIDYNSSTNRLQLRDTFGYSRDSNSAYLCFTFSGTNMTASKRFLFNTANKNYTEDTSFSSKYVYYDTTNSYFKLNSSASSITPYDSGINLSIPSSFNPTSRSMVTNSRVDWSSWAVHYNNQTYYGNKLYNDTYSTYQAQLQAAGDNASTTAAAETMLSQIKSDLASSGGALRYDSSVYLAFRSALLKTKVTGETIVGAPIDLNTAPYVYFTNESDSSGVRHPFMVIFSWSITDRPNRLLDVPVPPGDGSGSYATASVTRDAVLQTFLHKIPLKDYGEVSSVTENTLSASLASNAGSTSYTVYSYAGISAIGIAVDGVQIYPVFNNVLLPAVEKGEITNSGIHVGQGMGLHWHADGHGATGNGLNLYNLSDYEGYMHPPLIGFGLDGVALYGKYESSYSYMDGYDTALGDFGGHEHGSYNYHYHAHSQSSSIVCSSNDYTMNILMHGAWKGKINDIPEFWNSKETSKPATTPAQANKYIGDSRAF